MSADSDRPRNDAIRFVSFCLWIFVVLGLALGLFVADVRIIRYTLTVGWGTFVLYFLWRIALAVEHVAFAP